MVLKIWDELAKQRVFEDTVSQDEAGNLVNESYDEKCFLSTF